MSVSSIQLPTERALQELLYDSGAIDPSYDIVCAHDVDKPPSQGNFLAITAGPGDFEELIDNALTRVEFRVATQVADADQRVDRATLHQAIVGEIHNILSWGNFDSALATLNAQQTTVGGITIGISGWEQMGPPMDNAAGPQIISTLPYDFEVFVAAAES